MAQEIRRRIAGYLAELVPTYRQPTLAVLMMGNDPGSAAYVRMKQKACYEVGISAHLYHVDTRQELLALIHKLNHADAVDGILLQLPLPQPLKAEEILSKIDPSKDVDGLHPVSLGRLLYADPRGVIPCTPKGIVALLKASQWQGKGKRVTLIGRSLIVGRPLSILLSHPHWGGDATVTLAHSHSEGIRELCQEADLLICAVGRPGLVRGEWIKPGAWIVDVGITRTSHGLVGDIALDEALQHAGAATPVPGGVGPMTVAMLMENLTLLWARSVGAPAPHASLSPLLQL